MKGHSYYDCRYRCDLHHLLLGTVDDYVAFGHLIRLEYSQCYRDFWLLSRATDGRAMTCRYAAVYAPHAFLE